jgi:hypothetical protein
MHDRASIPKTRSIRDCGVSGRSRSGTIDRRRRGYRGKRTDLCHSISLDGRKFKSCRLDLSQLVYRGIPRQYDCTWEDVKHLAGHCDPRT